MSLSASGSCASAQAATKTADRGPPVIELCSARALSAAWFWYFVEWPVRFMMVLCADISSLLRAMYYTKTSTSLVLKGCTTFLAKFQFAFKIVINISEAVWSCRWKIIQWNTSKSMKNIGCSNTKTSDCSYSGASNFKTFVSKTLWWEFCEDCWEASPVKILSSNVMRSATHQNILKQPEAVRPHLSLAWASRLDSSATQGRSSRWLSLQ